jgi:hypothetical protein
MVEINTLSISKLINKGQTELESMDILSGPSSRSREMKQNNMHKPTENWYSIFNKSEKPQSASLFVEGRKRQQQPRICEIVCAFNLLAREERRARLQELVTEVKKKHDETLKS